MTTLADLALGDVATSAELLVMTGGQAREHAGAGAQVGRTRFLLYSVSKMITATAVLRMVESGDLDLGTRIASVIPAFGQGSKEDVTVKEVLSHSAGIPGAEGLVGDSRPIALADCADWDHFVELVCAMPLQTALHGRGVYHGLTFGILGAVVERASGRDFRSFCAAEVFEPLRMSSTTWGLPLPVRDDAAGFHRPHAEMWRSGIPEDAMVPAGGAWSTAGDVARLLLMLRDEGLVDGRSFLRASIVQEAEARRVPARDNGAEVLDAHHAWSYGLGLLVNGDEPVFARGSQTAPGTFGHSGATANQAFHDPTADLTLVCLTNSCVTQEESDARFDKLCDAAYGAYGA
jgi:CubicO group peptidase (beta-lactamase class C family)